MGNTAETARARGRGGEWQVRVGMQGMGLTHLTEVAADRGHALFSGCSDSSLCR